MAAAQPNHSDYSELAPCEEGEDDYPEEDTEEDGDDFTVHVGATYSCKRTDGTYRDGEVVKFRINKRAGREEYLVHYVGLTRRQAEWVDKTRLVLSNKEADVEKNTDQNFSENELPTQKPRSEEDQPETKKMKLDSLVCKDKERACLKCGRVYQDMVLVKCGHSLCRSCMDKAWAREDSLSCPDCNKAVTKQNTDTNLGSADPPKTTVCTAPTLTLAEILARAKARQLVNCAAHDEKLKLYCTEDGDLCCTICRDSLNHRGHRFLAVVDAVEVYRGELSAVVNPIEEAWKEASELTNQQSQSIEKLQNTVMEYRQHILSEFGVLHGFLKEQKRKLLQQLEDQSRGLLEEMEASAARMEENRESMKETLTVANQKATETDALYFLDGVTELMQKCQQQEALLSNMTVSDNPLCLGTFKGPIQYFAWKQMQSVVSVPECESQLAPLRVEEATEIPTGLPEHKDTGAELVQRPTPEEKKPRPVGPKEIWIVGNDFMTAVKQRAEQRLSGPNLGFDGQTCTVHWFGLGKHCSGLFSGLLAVSSDLPAPDIIYVHLSSDMGCDIALDLVQSLRSDLRKLVVLFSGTEIMVSLLLPRPAERWQEDLNTMLAEFAGRPRFHLLRHGQLEKELEARSTDTDSSRLTDAETDLFLTGMMDALQKAVLQDIEPATDICEGTSKESDGTPAGKEVDSVGMRPKEIWIVGDVYVTAANRRAGDGSLGLNLGLEEQTCTVRWLDLSNTWLGLFSILKSARKVLGTPDVLLIHTGSDDIGPLIKFNVVNCVQECSRCVTSCFPNTELIVSPLLPKPGWVGMDERQRKAFNSYLTGSEKKGFYSLVNHHNIEKTLKERYKTGDHGDLTVTEIDLFLTAIREAVQEAMSKDHKPVTDRCESTSEVKPVSTSSSHVKPIPGPKEIWMVGDGFAIAANRRAAMGPLGLNLGFERPLCAVRWLALSKTWFGLFSTLKQVGDVLKTPDVIFIHLGSGDIGSLDYSDFIKVVTECAIGISKSFPNTELIVSSILPEPGWWGTPLLLQYDSFNSYLNECARKSYFSLLRHDELHKMLVERYTAGDHQNLTDAEADLFLTGIRDALQKAIFKDSKPNTAPAEAIVPARVTAWNSGPGLIPDPVVISPKDIWIVGNDFMRAAIRRAQTGPLGPNLGLGPHGCTLRWWCTRDTWFGFFLQIKQDTPQFGGPYAILVYLGSSDIEFVPLKALHKCAKGCLAAFQKYYPKSEIVVSTLLPKPEWNRTTMENCELFNSTLINLSQRPRFHPIGHKALQKKLKERYASGDLSYLADSETDLFLTGLRDALQEALLKDYKSDAERCKVLPSTVIPSQTVPGEGLPSTDILSQTIPGEGLPSADVANETVLGEGLPSTNIPGEGLPSTAIPSQTIPGEGLPSIDILGEGLPSAHVANETVKGEGLPSAHVANETVPGEGLPSADVGNETVPSEGPPSADVLNETAPNDTVHSEDAAMETDQPSAGKEMQSVVKRPKEIWVVGSGYMTYAIHRAETGPLGFNLGFPMQICTIRWWNLSDTWFDLLPKLKPQSSYVGTPDIICIHLGISDLERVELNTLISSVEDCFSGLSEFYPNTEFMLSTLILKPLWRGTRAEQLLNDFNSYLAKLAESPRFHLIRHDNLAKRLTERYLAGCNDYLRPGDVDVFLKGIRNALRKTIFQGTKPRVAKCQKPLTTDVPSMEVQSKDVISVDVTMEEELPSTDLQNEVMHREKLISIDVLIKEVRSDLGTISADDQSEEKQSQELPSAGGPSETGQSKGRAEEPDQSSSLKSDAPRPKEIWIIGNFYINKASLHARNSYFGSNLGYDERQWVVRWMDQTTNLFSLLTNMHCASHQLETPSIVYLHIGSNDLETINYNILINDFMCEMGKLVKLYPETQFIFSAVLPKMEWLFNPLEEFRKRLNTAMGQYAKKLGFEVVANGKLEDMLLLRFQEFRGYSPLTYPENDLFLTNLKLSIDNAMLKGRKPLVEKQKRQKEVLSTGDTLIVVVPGNVGVAEAEEHMEEAEENALGTDCAAVTGEYTEALEASDYPTCETTEETLGRSEDAPQHSPLPNTPARKQIWIVGNSYICRATRQAKSSAYGDNLGFELEKWVVHWVGRISMRWEALLPELKLVLSTLGAPSIIFIHLGDNDLGCIPYDTFTKVMEDCLSQLTMQFPTAEFVFSTILPRAEWLTNPMEQSRQDVNRTLISYAEELGFHVAVHDDIEETAISRFNAGGSSVISDTEYDLFVKNIKEAVEMAVRKVDGACAV